MGAELSSAVLVVEDRGVIIIVGVDLLFFSCVSDKGALPFSLSLTPPPPPPPPQPATVDMDCRLPDGVIYINYKQKDESHRQCNADWRPAMAMLP
jgi:hypothetical protein